MKEDVLSTHENHDEVVHSAEANEIGNLLEELEWQDKKDGKPFKGDGK